jgi:PHD/YefM family antitoxin component YafN of YafNO toxin-antitoxin module
MKKVTATDLKNKSGACLEMALQEPIQIEKSGRTVAVLLNSNEYERLVRLENEYWMARAQEGEASGFIGVAASNELLKKLMNAAD